MTKCMLLYFICQYCNGQFYTSAHVILNLFKELTKKLKARLAGHLLFFHNELNKFNNSGAVMLDNINHMTL